MELNYPSLDVLWIGGACESALQGATSPTGVRGEVLSFKRRSRREVDEDRADREGEYDGRLRFMLAMRGAFGRQVRRKLIKEDRIKYTQGCYVPRFKFAVRGAFARQIGRKTDGRRWTCQEI